MNDCWRRFAEREDERRDSLSRLRHQVYSNDDRTEQQPHLERSVWARQGTVRVTRGCWQTPLIRFVESWGSVYVVSCLRESNTFMEDTVDLLFVFLFGSRCSGLLTDSLKVRKRINAGDHQRYSLAYNMNTRLPQLLPGGAESDPYVAIMTMPRYVTGASCSGQLRSITTMMVRYGDVVGISGLACDPEPNYLAGRLGSYCLVQLAYHRLDRRWARYRQPASICVQIRLCLDIDVSRHLGLDVAEAGCKEDNAAVSQISHDDLAEAAIAPDTLLEDESYCPILDTVAWLIIT
nr:hypothetical protein CFP56_22376 [Quercus suber]